MENLVKHTTQTTHLQYLSVDEKSKIKLAILKSVGNQGIAQISQELSGETNVLMLKLQQSVTMQRILSEKQTSMKDAMQIIGLDQLQKAICVAVKFFVDSLQVANKMQFFDYMQFSLLFIEKYDTESVEDLILALKYAKIEGRKFYNAFGTQDLFEIFAEYQDRKAHERENQHLKVKASSEKSNLLELINNTDNPEMRNYVDLIKKDKPRPEPIIKTKNLDDEINELKAYFLQPDVSLSDCIKFQESCCLRGLDKQYEAIRKVIEIKQAEGYE